MNPNRPRTTVLVPLDDTPRDAAIRAALAYSREHTDMRVRLMHDHCLIGEAVNGVWYPTYAHHHPSCPARLGDGECICGPQPPEGCHGVVVPVPTGRKFIVDSMNGGEIVAEVPDHDDYSEWTEYRDEDGALSYVSDTGMTLDAEEFGS